MTAEPQLGRHIVITAAVVESFLALDSAENLRLHTPRDVVMAWIGPFVNLSEGSVVRQVRIVEAACQQN